VEFLKTGDAINSEQYVPTLKKLKQQIQRVWPNRKLNQFLSSLPYQFSTLWIPPS
jgi:hypothetical protein